MTCNNSSVIYLHMKFITYEFVLVIVIWLVHLISYKGIDTIS